MIICIYVYTKIVHKHTYTYKYIACMHVSHTLAHHSYISWHATLIHNTRAHTHTTHTHTHTCTYTSHVQIAEADADKDGNLDFEELWAVILSVAEDEARVRAWLADINVAHGVINIQTYILMHLGSVWCTHHSLAHSHTHTHALLYLDYFNTNWMVSSCLLGIGCMFRLNW